MARVQARTRQFAKRQATWFRGLAEVRSWPVPRDEPAEVTAARLAERIEQGTTRAVSFSKPQPLTRPSGPLSRGERGGIQGDLEIERALTGR